MTKQNKILLGVGIAGVAAYYLWKSSKKNYTNFSSIDYNKCIERSIYNANQLNASLTDCMAQNPTSGVEKCCIVVGGFFVNGVCSPYNNTNMYVECCKEAGGTLNGKDCIDPNANPANDCASSGGIWDANTATCTPCADATHMVYNGQCMLDEQVKCISELGGNWVNGTCELPTLDCPTNEVLVNGVCTCPEGYHYETTTTAASETRVCVKDTPSTPTGQINTTIVTPPPYFPGLSNLPTTDGSAGSGGGGGDTDKLAEDLFDWIPWILAGMTTALSVVSEQKQQ